MAFCPTTYSLLNVLWWNLLGQYMYYLFTKVFSITPEWIYNILKHLLPRFSGTAPTWFTCGWAWAALWSDNLDAGGLPNTAFVLFFRRVAKERFEDWIENAASIASAVVNTAIRGLLGSLLHGYTTFSTWIESIRNITGTWVPWWTSTLARGLEFLYNWLPSDVTAGLMSFYDKYLAWHEATKSWVRVTYDAAVAWASDAWDWVVNTGWQLNNWWLGIRDFLDGFFHYHVPWVKSWLGDPWSFLAGAWDGLRNFYNNIWVPYKITLHDFLADPLGWTYDRVEDELIRRW